MGTASVDWQHIGEVVLGNVFVAGVAYGAIKSELKNIHERLKRVEDDIREFIFKGN